MPGPRAAHTPYLLLVFFPFMSLIFLLCETTPSLPFSPHREAVRLAWTAGVAQGGLWPSGAVSAWCAGALHRGLSLKGLPIKLNCCQQSTDLYLFSSLISIQNRPFRRLATADCAAVCLFGFLRRNLLSTGQAHPLLVSKAYNCHCLPWSTKKIDLTPMWGQLEAVNASTTLCFVICFFATSVDSREKTRN